MGRWRVLVTIDATVSLVVEAETEDEAKELAMDDAQVTLCHQCAGTLIVNDPMEAVEALEITDEEDDD